MSKKKNMVNAVRKDFVDRAYDILELCNLVKNRQQASEIEREETMMQLRNIFDAAKQMITIDDGVVLWMNAHKPSVFHADRIWAIQEHQAVSKPNIYRG